MKRWLAMAAQKSLAGCAITLLTLGLLSGCQQTFLAQEVYNGAQGTLPSNIEKTQTPIIDPITVMTPKPPTVNDADRIPRYLSLQEAIAIGLESGTVSSVAISNLNGLQQAPGGGPPTTNGFNQSPNSQNDTIRVMALTPAVKFAAMEASVARFDPVFTTGYTLGNVDELQQGFTTNLSNGNSGNFNASIIKQFSGGGTANMSFSTGYLDLKSPPAGFINPLYTARWTMGFEQPLLKNWGVEINELLASIPLVSGNTTPSGTSPAIASSGSVSVLNQLRGSTAFLDGGNEGILISRLRFDQSRAHFENNINALLVNVEVAYWNLYSKYGQLYSIEENLRLMHKTWQENYNRFQTGGLPPASYYQILGQYEDFRGERIRALNEVIEAERNMRSILGMKLSDGERLVPITPPTMAHAKPSWEVCMQDAMKSRPDLAWARQELQYYQYLLAIQKNNLKPDLRTYAKLEPVGFGTTLTGSGNFLDATGTARPSNAYQSLASTHFVDYSMGIFMNVPLGFRAEYAAIRAAKLELTKSYLILRDWENQVSFQVAKEYQELEHWYKRIEAHRAERIGYQENVKKLLERIKAGQLTFGGDTKEGPFVFLDSQRRHGAALIKEYNAIAEYNNTLARLEWAKGTIQSYNNVRISEGELPQAAQVRAVEYEKERSKALVLRNRPDSLRQPGQLAEPEKAIPEKLEIPPPAPLSAPNVLPPIEKQEDLPIAPRKVEFPTAPPSKIENVSFKPAAPPSKVENAVFKPVAKPNEVENAGFKPMAPASKIENVSFKPATKPMAAPPPLPTREPAPLPQLETTPAPTLPGAGATPENTNWKQASPLSKNKVPEANPAQGSAMQAGSLGFVPMPGAKMLATRVGQDPSSAVLAPTANRPIVGELQPLPEMAPLAR